MPGTFWTIGGNGSTGAVGDSTNDGATWTTNAPPGEDSNPTGFAYSPTLKLWVHGGTASTINWSTAPHTSWTGATSDPFTSSVRTIIWVPEIGAAGEFLAGAEDNRIASSSDGKNWTERLGSGGAFIRCLAWSPSLTLAIAGGVSGTLWTSSDGHSWAHTVSAAMGIVNGAAWGNGHFVIVGESSGTPTISYSTDGATFTAATVPAGFTGLPWTVYWSEEFALFFAATLTGKIVTSPDGATWTSITSPFGSTGVAFASTVGPVIVAVGGDGSLYTSPDGSTWTSRTSGFGSTPIAGILWADSGRGLVVRGYLVYR